MRTIALRLYGKKDLRLESFDLPEVGEEEILADITTNSICMSSYKTAIQGEDHKRVPSDILKNPVIIGHECSGTILQVGKKAKGNFKVGDRYGIQPALSIPGRELDAPGYSFPTVGGHATKILIPAEVMEQNCLLHYDGRGFFKASLSEPMSCIIGAFKTSYHYQAGGYVHINGIVEGGNCAILAGAGPMGLGAIDFALHGPRKPGLLVVTDIDQARLDRVARLFSSETAQRDGVRLIYVNTANTDKDDPIKRLMDITSGKGFDDIFVFAPVPPLIEQASRLLGFNGCLNFFAGPSQKDFWATINFYEVHYSGHHVVGSSGGNTEDMQDALDLMSSGAIDPAIMITHVGGLDAAAEAILHLPEIPGGKKLIYTQISMPLTAIESFAELGEKDPFFRELAQITGENDGIWSVQAEDFLVKHAPSIEKTLL
jgi:threonine dehydrogenase-like Zn-dependent dehydrogenase